MPLDISSCKDTLLLKVSRAKLANPNPIYWMLGGLLRPAAAHILWFSKYTCHMKETHPSAFTGTSSLTRCHWLHWGQNLRKEEPILFFSTGLELLMDALPKSLHPHWKKWCDCMLMFLLVAMHYLLNRPEDWQLLLTCVLKKKKNYLSNTILCFSVKATGHYCQVMSETDPSLVSVALSIKTWCFSSLCSKCLWTS